MQCSCVLIVVYYEYFYNKLGKFSLKLLWMTFDFCYKFLYHKWCKNIIFWNIVTHKHLDKRMLLDSKLG